jgi:hypothetical protein
MPLAEPAAGVLAGCAAQENESEGRADERLRGTFQLQQKRQEGQKSHADAGIDHPDREQQREAAPATVRCPDRNSGRLLRRSNLR